mgnify:CR=1 FL=1
MDEEVTRLLGGLFRFNEAIPPAVTAIRPHVFRAEADRLVFDAIATSFERNNPVD